jgi:hypothetical protein
MKALRPLTMIALLAVGVTVQAAASAVPFGPHDMRSLFHVEKSENKNQVHYALRLDSSCKPVGKQPVFGYWRRLKGGERVDAPLVGPGARVYGPSDEQKVERTSTGVRINTFVKALPRLRIEVKVDKGASGCNATAYTMLKGARARLSYAYLQLGTFGMRVKYVDVVGKRVSDGVELKERFQ